MRRFICWRLSRCQLSQFVGSQIEHLSLPDWPSLQPCFDDGATPQFLLKVVKLTLVKFWPFVWLGYLNLRQFSKRQNFDNEIAVQNLGVVSPFVDYGESNFKGLIYVKGRRSNQSNISHDQVWAELQTDLLPNDAQLPASKDRIERADYDQPDATNPERWSIPAFIVGVFLFLAGNLFVYYGAERAENRCLIGFGWNKYGLLIGAFLCLLGGLTLMFLVPFWI